MKQIEIKEEFKKLIPALTTEEYKQLEDNCLEEGIREKIILWNNYIIDGHNRYNIANQWNLEFETKSKNFNTIEDVKIWMLDNQFGKRNLSDAQRYLNRNEKRKLLKEQGEQIYKEKSVFKGNQHTAPLSTIDNEPKHNTQKIIANELGWSTGKVAMADVVFKKATPEIEEKVLKNEITINQAYKEIKKEEKKEERINIIKEQIEDIESGKVTELKGLYNVISIDPAWNYEGENKNITSYDANGRRVANPYPEMSTQEIKDIKLPLLNDSVVFLWTTHKFLPDAFDILKNWNLNYKATLVWNKEKIGMGAWFRMQCEFCLVGIKGKPYWDNTTYRDIINEPRRQHSRKPDAFFDMVDKITLGRKLEYFSREKREGWDVFGNDVNKY